MNQIPITVDLDEFPLLLNSTVTVRAMAPDATYHPVLDFLESYPLPDALGVMTATFSHRTVYLTFTQYDNDAIMALMYAIRKAFPGQTYHIYGHASAGVVSL